MKNLPKLSRSEMIALVAAIQSASGSEEEQDRMVEIFDHNCLHPEKNGLIIWPHGHPHDSAKPEPTPEEIVEKALNPASAIIIRNEKRA